MDRILRGPVCPLILGLAPLALHAQAISTVREVEFRSRWSNYHVDQSQVERATSPADRETQEPGAETGILPRLRSFFQNGPVVLRGAVTNGWEYSNSHFPTAQLQNKSDSSFFTAPAVAASYDRAVGPWAVSFRYSAGYLRYLDGNYAPLGGTGGGLSQTAGLNVARQGSRLAFRTSASASSGSGFDIERNQQMDRKAIGGSMSADYSITEFMRAGASLNASHQNYSRPAGGFDDTIDQWAGTIFGESIVTGKTSLRLEFGTGQDTQLSGGTATRDRSYYQGVLRVNFQPTAKLTLTPAIGFGVLDGTGGTNGTAYGFRTLYSLGVDYVPTEKTSVRLFVGLEGAAAKPELTLAINWHPRENTLLNLSVYQQTGFSTILNDTERTRRGALLSAQQRLFGRLNVGVTGGWEQEESINTSATSPDPYYFFATTLAWEMNSWLTWQAQYRYSSGRGAFGGGTGTTESRASTSFQLTF